MDADWQSTRTESVLSRQRGVELHHQNGVHPYLGLEASDGSRLQVIAGYGLGGMELDQEGYETEMLDSSYASFGASGNRVLYSSDSLLFGDTSELTLESEPWMSSPFLSSGSYVISDMRTDARHQRIPTIGSHEHVLEIGVTVSPSVSMGLREDGRRGKSFLGMEMGGGIGFTNPHGYEISTKGEVLFAGTDQVQEWGMSGQLSYDSGSDGLGVQLSVASEWGRNMLGTVVLKPAEVLWFLRFCGNLKKFDLFFLIPLEM